MPSPSAETTAAPSAELALRALAIPPDTPERDLPALFLAALSLKPHGWDDLACQHAISALRFQATVLAGRFPNLTADPPGATPADLVVPEARREALLERVWRDIDVAMAAAHATRRHILHTALRGDPSFPLLPSAVRHPGERGDQIDRTIVLEDGLRDHMRATGGEPHPVRMPAGEDALAARRNFRARVIKPVEDVLHLALGLHHAVQRAEDAVFATTQDPAAWQASIGAESYRVENADGSVTLRPRLVQQHLLLLPDIVRRAIDLAEQYRPATEVFLREGRRQEVPPLLRIAFP